MNEEVQMAFLFIYFLQLSMTSFVAQSCGTLSFPYFYAKEISSICQFIIWLKVKAGKKKKKASQRLVNSHSHKTEKLLWYQLFFIVSLFRSAVSQYFCFLTFVAVKLSEYHKKTNFCRKDRLSFQKQVGDLQGILVLNNWLLLTICRQNKAYGPD